MPSTIDYHRRPRSRAASSKHGPGAYYDGPSAARLPSVTRKRSTSNPEDLHAKQPMSSTAALPRVSTMQQQQQQPSPMFSRSTFEGARTYPAPSSSRYFLTVIPPLELPLDPPHPRSTAASAGSSSHVRRGTLVPLYPTLGGQLYAIAREYGLPSIGGLAIYLCDDGEGNLGPRIGDSAWSALWARHFDDEWAASPDLAMMTHEREASSASSSGDWRPATTTTRGSQAATATTSNRASPMPYANGGGVTPSPRYSRAHQSNSLAHSHSQAHPYSHSQPQSRMGAATATPSSSLLFGSRLPIVGRVEWTVDRNRAPWWNAWVAEAEASGTTSTPSLAAAHTPSAAAAAAAAAMADRSGTSMASGFGGAYMPASGFSSAGGLAKRSRSHRRRSLHLRGGSAMSRRTRSRSGDDDEDDEEEEEEEGGEDGGDEMTSGSPLARRAEPSEAYSRSENHPSPVQTMTRSSYGTGSPLEPVRALDRGSVAAPALVAHAGPAEPERGDHIEDEGEGENLDDDEGENGDDSNEQIGASSSVDEDADEERKNGAAAAAAGYMALDDEATADTQLTSLDGGLLPSSHQQQQQQQQQQQHGLLDVSRPTTMAHSADADGGSTAGFGSYNGYSALLDVDDEKETTSRGGAASHRSLVADGDAGHLPSFEMMPDSDEGMWMDLQRHSGGGGGGGQHQLRLSAQSLSDHARTPRGREAGPHPHLHPHQPLSVAALPRSSSVEEWITKTGRHSGLQGGDAVNGNDEDDDDDEDGLLPPQDDIGEVMGLWAQSDAVFPPQYRLSRDGPRDTQASARNSGEKQLGAASGSSRPHSTSRSPSPNAPLVPPPNEALPALPQQPRSHAALAAGPTTAASASLLSPIALDSSPSAFSGPSANLGGLAMATMASKRRHLVGEEDEQEEEEEEEGGLDERGDMSSSSVDSNAIIGLGTTLPPSSHTHSHPQSSPRLELPSASGDEQSRRSSMTEQSDTLLDMERAVALLSPGQSPALLQHDVTTTPTPSTMAAPASATSFSSSRDSFAKAKSLSTSVTPSPRWLKASSASALSVMPRSASALVAASASAAAAPRPPLHRGGSQTPPARLTEEGAQGQSPSSLAKSSSSPRPASSPAATTGGGLQTKKRVVSQESRDGARDEQGQGEAYPVLNRQSPSAASEEGLRYDEDEERGDDSTDGEPSRASEDQDEDEDEEGGEKMWRNNSQLQLLGTQGWSETTGDQSRSLNTPMDEAGEMPPWRQPTPVMTAAVAADHESTPTQVQGAFVNNGSTEGAATALPSTPLYHEASVGPEYVTVGVQADQSPLGDDDGDYRDDDDDDDDGDGDGGRERGNGSDDGHAYQHGRDDSLFSLVSMGAASETMDHSESAPDIDGAKPLQTPAHAPVPAQAQAEVETQTQAEADAHAEAQLKAQSQAGAYEEAQFKAQSQTEAPAESPGLQEYHRRVMPQGEDHAEQRPSIERLIRGNSFAESCESSASSSKGPSPAMAHFEFPKRTKVGSPQQLQQQPLQLTPAAIMHATPKGYRRDDGDYSDEDDVWSQEGSHDDGAPRAFSEVEGARTPTFLYDQHLGESGRAAHDGHSSYISSSSTIGRSATGGMDDLDRRVDQMLSSVGSRYPDDVPLPSSSLPMSMAAAASASAPATTAYAPFLEQMNLQRQQQQQQQQQQRYDDVPPLAAALVSPPFLPSANGKLASIGRRPSSLSSSAAAEAGAARRASASSLAASVPHRTKASPPPRPMHFDPPPAVLARNGGGGGPASPASPAKMKPVVSPLVLVNQSPRQRFGTLPPSPRQFPPHILNQHSPTFPPPPPLAASTNGFGAAGSPYQSPTLSPSMGPYMPAQRPQTTQPQHTP